MQTARSFAASENFFPSTQLKGKYLPYIVLYGYYLYHYDCVEKSCPASGKGPPNQVSSSLWLLGLDARD